MNAFLEIAEQQMSGAVKARHRAVEKRKMRSDAEAPMITRGLDKEMEEAAKLKSNYRAIKRQEKLDLLNGPHGKDVRGLIALIDSLTIGSGNALVEFIQNADWIQQADQKLKYAVLELAGVGIARLRIRHAMAPYDDSLPGEPPTAYEIIRKHLTGVGYHG